MHATPALTQTCMQPPPSCRHAHTDAFQGANGEGVCLPACLPACKHESSMQASCKHEFAMQAQKHHASMKAACKHASMRAAYKHESSMQA
eukprot:87885-Chlamydomonas_euryale.AAC.1